ncbi:MAG: hypothetical protein F6K41_05235 [Symploca sp. SIO3E6]|nr:hypothetical protein [Caldora sp. SIO3E6]
MSKNALDYLTGGEIAIIAQSAAIGYQFEEAGPEDAGFGFPVESDLINIHGSVIVEIAQPSTAKRKYKPSSIGRELMAQQI